jgi:serine/threonine protein kinase
MIGKTIGTYKITGTIGSGGMGEVFVGEDLMLERQVAIKQLRPELASRPDVVQRFRSEAVILAKLHHTNIATVYAFLQEGANFFLVMEYVQGWTLQNIIEVHGALAPAVAVGLCQQALDGISFAHQRHIIHRDLKPSNVMLTDSGVIKVMDFGLARVLGSAHLTRTGRLMGTLEYISPEQIRGEETDARSDIYALGIVLYELVTGRLPFESDSEYTLVRAQVEALPPSPRHITPVVSPELEHVILRALAKAPTERFQSIEEFSLALAHCVPKAEPRETLSALLAALNGNPCTTGPANIQNPEAQPASQPAVASARIKATRRARAVDLSAIGSLFFHHFWAWKCYLVPSLILASSVAVVGLLFLLGMPYAPSEPELSSRPLNEAMLPPTNPWLVAPQPNDNQALPPDQPPEVPRSSLPSEVKIPDRPLDEAMLSPTNLSPVPPQPGDNQTLPSDPAPEVPQSSSPPEVEIPGTSPPPPVAPPGPPPGLVAITPVLPPKNGNKPPRPKLPVKKKGSEEWNTYIRK